MQSSVTRYILAITIAIGLTFLVFWTMQSLISSGDSVVNDEQGPRLVDFVHMQKDDEVQTKDRKPKKPPAPPQEPPKPDMPKPAMDTNPSADNVFDLGDVSLGDLQVDAGLSGGASDSDVVPIVPVQPVYPRRALQRGLEGYVVVQFDVNELGAAENPSVIEADPPSVFNKAAMDSIIKSKFRPRMVDGKPVKATGQRRIVRFELDKNK